MFHRRLCPFPRRLQIETCGGQSFPILPPADHYLPVSSDMQSHRRSPIPHNFTLNYAEKNAKKTTKDKTKNRKNSVLFVLPHRYQKHKYRKTRGLWLFRSGGEGSRTPVRDAVNDGIYTFSRRSGISEGLGPHAALPLLVTCCFSAGNPVTRFPAQPSRFRHPPQKASGF